MGQSLIKVKGVPTPVKQDLKNIAKNTGLTLSAFLKQKFRDITESYPAQMKIKREV